MATLTKAMSDTPVMTPWCSFEPVHTPSYFRPARIPPAYSSPTSKFARSSEQSRHGWRRLQKSPYEQGFIGVLLKEVYPSLTCHGFRSSFRDWCGDQTAYPREVAEAALAHALKDKTEAAYRRTDLFEKRARLMADWERYCHAVKPKAGNVTPIKRKRAG